jgi:hypothetical protein
VYVGLFEPVHHFTFQKKSVIVRGPLILVVPISGITYRHIPTR